MTDRIRVGFIGLNPDRNWAAQAHIPALKILKDRFVVVGVANSSEESGRRSAEAFGLRAFADADALVASDDVDLVVVTVKVPHHRTLVTKALEAGKHVYCEWPLGNGVAEAEELAALAERKQGIAAIGTQARVAPEILYLKQLIADGFVGKVLSTSIIADGASWGAETDTEHVYLYDAANGATLQSIPLMHTLAALQDVLGEMDAVDATRFAIRQPEVFVTDKKETIVRSSADEVAIVGRLSNGAPITIHYRGGLSRGIGLMWEIHGSEGDIQVTGAHGHAQMVDLAIKGARGDERELKSLVPPEDIHAGLGDSALVRNVAGIYARIADDIATGSRTAPSFADAVQLHTLLDRIERAGHAPTP